MDEALAPKRQETTTAKLRRTPTPRAKLVRSAFSGAMFAQSVNALVELDLYEEMSRPGGSTIATKDDMLRMFASGDTHYVRSTSISLETCRELARQTLSGRKIAFDKDRPDDPTVTAWVEAFRLVSPIHVVDRPPNGLDRDFVAKTPLFEADAVEMTRRANRVGAQLTAAFSEVIDEDGRIAKAIDEHLVARLRELSLYADVRPDARSDADDEELRAEPMDEVMPEITFAEAPAAESTEVLTPRQRQLREYARYLGVSEEEAARAIEAQQQHSSQSLAHSDEGAQDVGIDSVPVALI